MILPRVDTLTLRARPERVLIRPNGSYRHVLLTVSAPAQDPTRPRSPIALALVVDQTILSEPTRQSLFALFRALASTLTEEDSIAALIFGRDLAVLQPAEPATPALLSRLAEQFTHLEPTADADNLHGALLQGALTIATDEVRDLSRVWLFTRGIGHLGAQPETIVENAASVRQHAKVGTSVFALGNAYDPTLLGRLAISGGGRFHHLSSVEEFASVAEAELRDLTATTASQVTFEVAAEPGITVEPVSAVQAGHLSAEGVLPILLGEIPAGAERSIVVRFGFEPCDIGARRALRVRATRQVEGIRQATEWQNLIFTCTDNTVCNLEPQRREVMHWVGLHHAARAKVLGGRYFLQGDETAARGAVAPVAHRLAQYARGDAALEHELAFLQRLVTGGFRQIPRSDLPALLAQWQHDGRGEGDAIAVLLAEVLSERLGTLTVGPGRSHGGMTVFPVTGPSLRDLTYRTLAQSIADGSVEVVEQAMATVPELVLRNQGEALVFILEGEEVIGGQQIRIASQSALIGPNTTVALPVNCVEAGRWRPTSARFSVGETAYYNLRKGRQRAFRRDERGRLVADQSRVWDEIANKQETLAVHSPSSAMSDLYRAKKSDLESYESAFPYPSGSLGLVVALNGRLAGAEIFARRSLAGALWSKLIRSYAMDASNEPSAPVSLDRAVRLLNRVHGTTAESFPAIDRGQNFRFSGNGIVGSALIEGETVVHASIFREYKA